MSCLRQWISLFDPDWAMYCPPSTKTLLYLPTSNRPSPLNQDLIKQQSSTDKNNSSNAQNQQQYRRFFEMTVRGLCSPNVLHFDPKINSCTLTSFQNEKLIFTKVVSAIDVNRKFVVIHHIPFSFFDEHILFLFPKKQMNQI